MNLTLAFLNAWCRPQLVENKAEEPMFLRDYVVFWTINHGLTRPFQKTN